MTHEVVGDVKWRGEVPLGPGKGPVYPLELGRGRGPKEKGRECSGCRYLAFVLTCAFGSVVERQTWDLVVDGSGPDGGRRSPVFLH